MNRFQISPLSLCFSLLFFHFTLYAGEEQKRPESIEETAKEMRIGKKIRELHDNNLQNHESSLKDLEEEIENKKKRLSGEEKVEKTKWERFLSTLPLSKRIKRKREVKKLEKRSEKEKKEIKRLKSEIKKLEQKKNKIFYRRILDGPLGALLKKVKREKKIDNKKARETLDEIFVFTTTRYTKPLYQERRMKNPYFFYHVPEDEREPVQPIEADMLKEHIPYYEEFYNDLKSEKLYNDLYLLGSKRRRGRGQKKSKEEEKRDTHNSEISLNSCLTHCSEKGLEQLDSNNYFLSVNEHNRQSRYFRKKETIDKCFNASLSSALLDLIYYGSVIGAIYKGYNTFKGKYRRKNDQGLIYRILAQAFYEAHDFLRSRKEDRPDYKKFPALTLFAKLVKSANGLSSEALDERSLEPKNYRDHFGRAYGEEYFQKKKYPGPKYLYKLLNGYNEDLTLDISVEEIDSLAKKMFEFQNEANNFTYSYSFGRGDGGAAGLLSRLIYLFTQMKEIESLPEVFMDDDDDDEEEEKFEVKIDEMVIISDERPEESTDKGE